jgi:eukaryotic-like serine/threonine-protein kinase
MTADPAEPSSLGVYSPGQVLLGKYRLIEPLARGGMGAVWRARDELLSSDVAVKIADAGSVAVARAHSEARLAAQLRHPAVCSTFDFGVSEQGDPLVVSELLKGDGLDEVLLVEGPLSPTRAVQLLLPILDALAAAHDAGIIHRDVKPSNLFLARDAAGNIQPKLLDFGIARGVSEATHLTVAGSICGTPDYMSPEQARGARDVDSRTDVWSVCATLYELVSGRVPFPGDNYNAVIFAVGQRDPAPLQLRDADRPLAKIIERGLRKPREERFQSARELARALSQFLLARGLETDVCGHSLRARISSAEINLPAEPVLPLLKLALPARREVPSRLAKTETRRSRHLLMETSPRVRMAALSLIAAFMALAAWRAQGSPEPATAETAAGPSVIQLPDSELELAPAQLRSAPPVSQVSEVSTPPAPPAAAPRAKQASDSQRTATAKRAKGATRGNALGYDFGL